MPGSGRQHMSSSLSELSTVGAQNGHAYDAIKGRPELSSVSADVLKHAQHHYNPGRDVVTRQENIPEGQFKARETADILRCAFQC